MKGSIAQQTRRAEELQKLTVGQRHAQREEAFESKEPKIKRGQQVKRQVDNQIAGKKPRGFGRS